VPGASRRARVVERLSQHVQTALALVAVLTAIVAAVSAAPKDPEPIDVAGLLARIGERVEAYYARAQSILCTETVRLQPMDYNFANANHVRKLVYELRVSWEPSNGDAVPEANVTRELVSIDGRKPKPNQEPECLDPKLVAIDPLSFLLPHHQREYKFTYRGTGRTGDRAAVMIDYVAAGSPPPVIKWKESCVSIDLPSRTSGRLWVDVGSGNVLRIDETVKGPYDIEVPLSEQRKGANNWLTLERADSSIRYKTVVFTDPEEVVMLPQSIELMSIVRGSGAPRLRVTQEYTSYQRFVTGGRVLP
jgi:hypothetical protein